MYYIVWMLFVYESSLHLLVPTEEVKVVDINEHLQLLITTL